MTYRTMGYDSWFHEAETAEGAAGNCSVIEVLSVSAKPHAIMSMTGLS